jgi:stage III sporulation protein AE
MRTRSYLLITFLALLVLLWTEGRVFAQPAGGTSSSIPGSSIPGSLPGVEAQEALLDQQRRHLDTKELDSFLQEMNQTWHGYGPDISLADFLSLYRSDEDSKYSPKVILNGLLRYLVREVMANADLLAKLVVLAIIAAILQQVQSAFNSESTGKLAYAMIYLVLIGLAITGFGLAVATAKQVMDALSGFMLAMLPTMLALLAGMGGLTSAALFHPLMVTFTSTASTIMVTVVYPLIFLAAMLDIVSGLNENFKLTHLASLFRQGAMYILGLTFTLFLGVVAVKGAAGAVADGVTMKTTKFVLGSFIPVVGKMFADATDLIFGSSILLKNALGMAGLTAIFFIAAFPLLKILSLVIVYQVAGALVEPAGAGQIAKMLTTIAKSLQLVFASVAVVALMFFVGVTVIVGAANLSVMVR